MSWGLEKVTVTYADSRALDDVDLTVQPGVITTVVGGDGAGKTTLTRAMVGLVAIESGRVARPKRIGYQPETSGVWTDLTVAENLTLVSGAHRMSETQTQERITELLEVTALSEARDRLGSELSGGMRQKLGVAMALLPDPELLILDEPTTGLDPVSRLELWAFVATAASTGCAVLVTTAYVEEAERAGSIVVLDEGKVLATGSLEAVLGATPGRVFKSKHRVGELSWRRGRTWRVWSPDGTPPPESEHVEADLQDSVTVAALARSMSA